MSKLKEMQDSCAVFATDLKTGNITWIDIREFKNATCDFRCEVYGKEFDLYLHWEEIGDTHGTFRFSVNDGCIRILESETAKEAAHEALQLVKQEAQKLVDLLDVEAKENNYTKQFLDWRGKYFYPKKEVKEWKSKQKDTPFSSKELEDRYKNAFLESPFNAKQ